MKIFRVHSVVTYPDGHPVKSASKFSKPEHAYNVTTWDVVLCEDCDGAISKVKEKYSSDGCTVKLFSVGHIADVTCQ